MNRQLVGTVLSRLADVRTTAAEAQTLMARLDGHELQAVAEVFRAFHEAETADALHAATMLLARWRDQPVVEALVPALKALIDEEEAGDLHKLAAADLLAHYGQPIDDRDLAEHLVDPAALAARMLDQVLEASHTPAAVIAFLDRLEALPPGTVLGLIDDLAGLEDARAVPLLAPVAHSANTDLAIAAVGALDQLIPVVAQGSAAAAARTSLQLVAAHHRDDVTRREAAHTLARWPATASAQSPTQSSTPSSTQSSAQSSTQSPTQSPVAATSAGTRSAARGNGAHGNGTAASVKAPQSAVFMSEPGEGGARLVLLLWPNRIDSALSDALVVYITDGGVHEYATAELLRPADLRALLERLAQGEIELDRAGVAAAERVLAAASAATLAAGGATAVGYAAWPQIAALIALAEKPA